jgi:hypothetical protein
VELVGITVDHVELAHLIALISTQEVIMYKDKTPTVLDTCQAQEEKISGKNMKMRNNEYYI